MLGMYPLGSRPIGALPRRVTITQVFAVLAVTGLGSLTVTGRSNGLMTLSTAGVGSFAGALSAIGRCVMAASGTGSFAPVLRASASATVSMQGSGAFGGSDAPVSVAQFSGVGNFAAVSYAFFLDGERACVHQELRTAAVLAEERTAIVPFEDRVYRVAAEPRGAGNQPRKRIC